MRRIAPFIATVLLLACYWRASGQEPIHPFRSAEAEESPRIQRLISSLERVGSDAEAAFWAELDV